MTSHDFLLSWFAFLTGSALTWFVAQLKPGWLTKRMFRDTSDRLFYSGTVVAIAAAIFCWIVVAFNP
jgi:hypothetical protein